ncbi:pleckstrin homology domain-containing family J member 1 isoform X1 [Eulemur rufifrons]|uniref:pleckstrin homology domain-containing family J member 1 isoform X1 n=1 Tax=Eulemur rufifrons TaxID=859984 RepID=UPI003743D721
MRRGSSSRGASGTAPRDLFGAGRGSARALLPEVPVVSGAMRYNEKELQALSRQPAELAAELGMRGPKKGSVVKRRLVKLVVNFLFYFRTDEAEPVGALLLERCRVAREEPSGFSISRMVTRCWVQRGMVLGHRKEEAEPCGWQSRDWLPPQASSRTRRGSTTLSAAVRSSVRSGPRLYVGPATSSCGEASSFIGRRFRR